MKNNFPIFKIASYFFLVASIFLTGAFALPTVTHAASCDLGISQPTFDQYPVTTSTSYGCFSGVGTELPPISGNVSGASSWASSFSAQVGQSFTLRVYIINSADQNSGAVMNNVAYSTNESDSVDGTTHTFVTTLTASNATNSGLQGSVTVNTPAGSTLQITSGSLSGSIGDMQPYFGNDRAIDVTMTVVGPAVVTPPPTVSVSDTGGSVNVGTFCVYTNGQTNDTISYAINSGSAFAGDEVLWSSTKNGVSTGETNDYYGDILNANGSLNVTANRAWTTSDIGSWTKTVSIYNGSSVVGTGQVSFTVQDCTPVNNTPTPITASLLVNGTTSAIVTAGDPVTYTWSSTNATAGSTSLQILNSAGAPVSADSVGNQSGAFSSITGTSGSLTASTVAGQGGYKYVFTYTASNSTSGATSISENATVIVNPANNNTGGNPPATTTSPTVTLSTNAGTYCVYTNNQPSDVIMYTVTSGSLFAGDKVVWSSTKNGTSTTEVNDFYGDVLDANGSWVGPANRTWNIDDVGSWTKTASIYNGNSILGSAQVSFTVQNCTPAATSTPIITPHPTISLTANTNTGDFCVYSNGQPNSVIAYTVQSGAAYAGDELLWSSTKNGTTTGEFNDYYQQNLDANGVWTGPANRPWNINDVGSWTKTVSIYNATTTSVLGSAQVSFTIQDCTPSTGTPPVITLVGANPAYVVQGQAWIELGATAQDAKDGNITSKIVETGTVNTAVLGTTTLTYSVTDSLGLSASTTRTVVVVSNTGGGGGGGPVNNTAQINVCLVIADQNNTIATSSFGLPTGLFTLNIGTTTAIASSSTSLIDSKTWSSGTFSPTRKTILSLNDSDCVTFTTLPYGTYYYAPVAVSGSTWSAAQYNDLLVNNLMDFSPYNTANPTSDGVITINSSINNPTIYVLEKYNSTATSTHSLATASLTINGSNNITVTASSTVNYLWSSTNGISASTTYQIYNTATNAPVASDACGNVSGPFSQISGLNGTLSAFVAPCGIGYTYVFTYSVTDSLGNVASSTATISIASSTATTTTNTITFTSPLTASGTVGTPFTYQATATSTPTSTIIFSLDATTLPPGTTFAVDTISGTPTVDGIFPVLITAGNGIATTSATVVITINPQVTGGGGGGCASCGPGGGGGGSNGPPVSGGGGGGGNGPVAPETLQISNEKVIEPSPGVAFLTWTTNIPATTQVGYGTNSVPTVSSIVAPFGYLNSTVEITALVTNHVIAIPIIDGNTYYFRPVSLDSTNDTAVGNELTLNTFVTTTTTTGGTPTVTSSGSGNVCEYLYDYLNINWPNNSPVEVDKLQHFLNAYEGFTTLPVTGVFDQQTFNDVESFQLKYTQDILAPWGTTTPTGFVYIFTKKKINEIYCANPNSTIAPPTQTQLNQPQVLPTNEVGFNTRLSNLAAALFAFPWNWMKGLFDPNECTVGPWWVCWIIDLLLLILVLILIWYWYEKRKREKEEAKRLEEVNKQLDLTKDSNQTEV